MLPNSLLTAGEPSTDPESSDTEGIVVEANPFNVAGDDVRLNGVPLLVNKPAIHNSHLAISVSTGAHSKSCTFKVFRYRKETCWQ